MQISLEIAFPQVLDEYDPDHPLPHYISSLKTSKRQYLSGIGGSSVFKKLSNNYDAYDEDIAMVLFIELFYNRKIVEAAYCNHW